MHRSKKKRNIIIFSLIGVLLCMAIGYAAFQTQLKVTGTTKVTSNWDIEITNVTSGTPTGSAENAVAPSFDKLWASMEANLYDKGDAMEYDVTIENKGTLDAKLNDILTNLSNSNSEAVIISFSGYTKGEVLKAKNTKVVHVKIEYNPEYEGGETSSEVEINFDYGQESSDPEKPAVYLLTYDYQTNGGNRTDSEGEYLISGSKVDLNVKAYKQGWTFVGWNTNKNAETALNNYQMPERASTLYAIYKKDMKVTYEKESNIESIGENSKTYTIYNNETSYEITLPSITPSEGYIVDGWYNESTKVGNPNENYTISDNVTLIAKAKADNITLSMSTTSTTNSITVVANATADSGIAKYEFSKDGGKTWETSANNTYTFTGLSQGTSYNIKVRVTSNSGKILEKGIIIRLEDLVSTNQEELYIDDNDNIRYYGADPNNYVIFNNELWRIIGVIDGKIKIIRNENIGKYYDWNENVQSGKNYNNWEGATLQTYLNGDYYNSIDSISKEMISEETFYLGGANSSNYTTLTASGYYNAERDSSQVYSGNPASTTQYIGLMYPSDYGYAAGSSCLSTDLFSYDVSCKNSDYLFSGIAEWVQSPYASDSESVAALSGSGFLSGIGNNGNDGHYAVRPVLYLNSNVQIVGGDGSKNNPFQLDADSGVTTSTLEKPTFSESVNNEGKTVTITYPEGCGSTLTCTYQKDSETIVEVKTLTAEVPFTMNGSVIAIVTDGTNTVNNSYNVTGITSLQAGDIKGGSINLSKEVAVDDETITITDYPDSTFSYQGSTIVCQNGTKYEIGSSEKTFSIDDQSCSSAIIYPSWKCADYRLFHLNSTPASIPWEFTKYDGLKGTFNNYTTSTDSGGSKYYAQIAHTAGASRNQISTSSTINVDNYKSYQIMTWCTNGGAILMGPTKSKNDWLQNLSTTVQTDVTGTTPSVGKLITNDITKLSGDYYFAIQEILTNGKDNACNINYAHLICQTYSYENPGNISFRETATTNGKTIAIVYPSGCGSTRTCTYQKNNGEEVEVTSNTVDVSFDANGSIVAKVTDENGTKSSSYTVSGIVSMSAGTVRGGSIKLSKNKAINGENITFTASPSSGFSYAGATVVCNNGSTHTISDTTAKIGTMGGCDSSATIYPNWRKSDYTIFKVDTVDSPTGWLSRYDTVAAPPTWSVYASQAEIDKQPAWYAGHKYYLIMAHTDNNNVRSQLTSQNSFDLTDYSTLYARYMPMHHVSPWGTGTNYLAVIPQSAGQNAWVHGQSNQVSSSTIADGESRDFNLNISSLKGNYYLGFQMLSTDGKPYGVDVLEMTLKGKTFTYNDRGV